VPPAASTTYDASVLPHFAAASSLTRSTNAVFSRPLKPSSLSAVFNRSRVPHRIWCVTRTSFRRRYRFLTCP